MAEDEVKKPAPRMTGWLMFYVICGILLLNGVWSQVRAVERIPYSQFLNYVQQDNISQVEVGAREVAGRLKTAPPGKPHDFVTVRVDPELSHLLAAHHINFIGATEDNWLRTIASWVVPALIFFGVWMLFLGRVTDQSGSAGSIMAIGQSKARVYSEERPSVSFADVAGIDEAKQELQEVVTFLKEPERYSRLGGRMPKGVLLIGPPGTGKTLLARAVAGEAAVPFLSISGSEFVEMFVGVGAARVRDLFVQAMKHAPCIIFIDELDALGKARGISPITGSHDEKEQTLNQLLVELDGFDSRKGVIILAASNRTEILDPALLRAGRFDRQVLVDRPDRKGRSAIIKVHMKDIVAEQNIAIDDLAGMTPGFTGADLANLVNEATLLAARRGARRVAMLDFTEALERIVAGLEKKNRLLSPHERKVVAYHEMGHALCAFTVPGSDPVHKVSIISRGIGALGYTLQRPTEDRFLMTRQELNDKMTVLLGGRAAEMLVFGDVSTGAADDLSKATDIAHNMITRYGMSPELGPVAYETDPGFLQSKIFTGEGRRFSEDSARLIDAAVKELSEKAFNRAKAVLQKQRDVLDRAAQRLLEKETLSREEIQEIIGRVGPSNSARPHAA